MKLRMIPYGYKVNNGKVELDETERRIQNISCCRISRQKKNLLTGYVILVVIHFCALPKYVYPSRGQICRTTAVS